MSKSKIPESVMHEPKTMAWTQLTPTVEHKKREQDGINPVIAVEPEGTTYNPIPVSKATTWLKRAYPYVFNCAAYALTHHAEKIAEDEFYKRFTMPVLKFYEYCLDGCSEQKEYLEKELYEILTGKTSKVKYIKVSESRTVLAQPVIITFSHTDLETGKEERIRNIGQNKRVDKVQIQILKEIMTFERGYLNVPKAFYAKTRRVFERMRKNIQPITDSKNDYWGLIKTVKSMATEPIDTPAAARAASIILEQNNVLASMEQGGFHKVYLAFEYILANRGGRKVKRQSYGLLKLCSKAAPEYTQETEGELYFKDKKGAFRFGLLIAKMVDMFEPQIREIIGIEQIRNSETGDALEVVFSSEGKNDR